MSEKKNENSLKQNALSLEKELIWLMQVLDTSLKLYFGKETQYADIQDIKPPDLKKNTSFYAQVIQDCQMSLEERIVLLLALVPHIRPQLLDGFFTKNQTYGRGFTEFGGVIGERHSGFMPTIETALFILAGVDLEKRFQYQAFFEKEHFFTKKNILDIHDGKIFETLNSKTLNIQKELLYQLVSNREYKQEFNEDFPARYISTDLDWEELILNKKTLEQVQELQTWILYNDILLDEWEMRKKIKPGYRALFYGPPGTGKTLTASLLGKHTNRDVYRIDLSTIVSKYIGETEKNLSKLFNKAQFRNWILFFDEADALFSKRTSVKDAHDKYANQEASYLLQRIENYPGVIILASNFKSNIDDAFLRRFHSIIYFPFPKPPERFRLWQKALPAKAKLATDIDLVGLAEKYELSGANIINVIQYACLQSIARESKTIEKKELIEGITKEYLKEGKIVE